MRHLDWGDIDEAQELLGAAMHSTTRYSIHPGDLAWWIHHHDQRKPAPELYMDDGKALVVIAGDEIDVFVAPDASSPINYIEWAQDSIGGGGTVCSVADTDTEVTDYLRRTGYRVVATDRSYVWLLDERPVPETPLGEGWALRHVLGEEEAENRRVASYAAFESTMDPQEHLQRYLRFMRSPVYVPENDLVAVAPDGRIASFMVWWPHESGISQIEPFGTHPDFHHQGVGRALIHHGLHRMKEAGMTVCRVCTNDYRAATNFYEAVGFNDVGALRWWAR